MLRNRRSLGANKNSDAGEYVRARQSLELKRRTIDDAFRDLDLVVCPTQRIVAPLLDDLLKSHYENKEKDPWETTNSGYFNNLGLPAISVPCGFSRAGLPIGLMIGGPRFSEGRVLALAHAYHSGERHSRFMVPPSRRRLHRAARDRLARAILGIGTVSKGLDASQKRACDSGSLAPFTGG